jgi:glutamyl-Q tRNA(Asp) synthetase
LPVAVNVQGEKLSKQTLAPGLNAADPVPQLVRVLDFLGQKPPPDLVKSTLTDFWSWAMSNWAVDEIPPQRTLPANIRD